MDKEPDLGVRGRREGMEQAAGTMVSDDEPRIWAVRLPGANLICWAALLKTDV